MAKQSKLILLLAVVILFTTRCANQLSPGGGEVDRIPPQILEIYPPNGTINFTDNYFELTFSEWVDKRSVQEAIFISPPLKKTVEYDWSGKSLTVVFKDTLKENTTYTISIGAEVEDINNRNKMAEPVTFAFSTGAQIDSGKISGKIFNDDPAGVMVYAFSNNDSISNPTIKKPDYISQVGKNGKYILLGLGNGDYSVFAFKDKYRDFLYQKNDDAFGVQSKKIILSDSIQSLTEVNFILGVEDTVPPKITNVYMRDINHFLIEFNEAVDSTKILASNFFLFDSTSSLKIPVRYFFKGDSKPNQYYLAIGDSLKEGNNIYLFGKSIFDLNGNSSGGEGNAITVKEDPDTTAPKILFIGGNLPDGKVDFDSPNISVKFDDGFDHSVLKSSIILADSKNNILQFDIITHDDSWFDIQITDKLKPKSDYSVSIDLNKLPDAAGNKIDSVYKSKFTTINDLDFSGVSGAVDGSENFKKTFLILESADKEKKTYRERADSKNKFDFKKVLPGKYILWSFKDKNNNGIYDKGRVWPMDFSEEFIFYPDTLNLRARWPVGDVKISYPEK